MPSDPITGKTLRWTYKDGPTAGKGFEHVFGRDGKASYGMDGSPPGERVDYQVARIAPGIHLVCYLAPSGWTLSTVIASNEEQIFVQHGKLETDIAKGALRNTGKATRKATRNNTRTIRSTTRKSTRAPDKSPERSTRTSARDSSAPARPRRAASRKPGIATPAFS